MADPKIIFTQSASSSPAGQAFDGAAGLLVTVTNDQGTSGKYYLVDAPEDSILTPAVVSADLKSVASGTPLATGTSATFTPDAGLWGTYTIWLVIGNAVVAKQDFIIGTVINSVKYRVPGLFSTRETFNYGGQTFGWKKDANALFKLVTTISGSGGSGVAYSGTGSPEGVVAAPVGSMYLDVTNQPVPSVWYKSSGSIGNTGWFDNAIFGGTFIADQLQGHNMFFNGLAVGGTVNNPGFPFTNQEWDLEDGGAHINGGTTWVHMTWDGVTSITAPVGRNFGLGFTAAGRTAVTYYDVPSNFPALTIANDLGHGGTTVTMIPGEVAWITCDGTNIEKLSSSKPTPGGFIVDVNASPASYTYTTIVGQALGFGNTFSTEPNYRAPVSLPMTIGLFSGGAYNPVVFDFDAYGDVVGGTPHPTTIKSVQGLLLPDLMLSGSDGDTLTLDVTNMGPLTSVVTARAGAENGQAYAITQGSNPTIYQFMMHDQTSRPTITRSDVLTSVPAIKELVTFYKAYPFSTTTSDDVLLLLTADSQHIYIVKAPNTNRMTQQPWSSTLSVDHFNVIGIIDAPGGGTFGIPCFEVSSPVGIVVGYDDGVGGFSLQVYDFGATVTGFPTPNSTPASSVTTAEFIIKAIQSDDSQHVYAISANNAYSFSWFSLTLTHVSTLALPGGQTAVDLLQHDGTDIGVLTSTNYILTDVPALSAWTTLANNPAGFTPGKIRSTNGLDFGSHPSTQVFYTVIATSGIADGQFFFPEEGNGFPTNPPAYVTHAGESIVGVYAPGPSGVPWKAAGAGGSRLSPYIFVGATDGFRRFSTKTFTVDSEFNQARSFRVSAPSTSLFAVNCAALASLSTGSFSQGTEAYVESLDAKFGWYPGADTSGVVLGNATNGPFGRFPNVGATGFWIRKRVPSTKAIHQQSWFIDPIFGNDEATGLDSGHPIKTNSEFGWRTNGNLAPNMSGQTVISYLNSPNPQALPGADLLPTLTCVSGTLLVTVLGVEQYITSFSGSVSGFTPTDQASNVLPSVDLTVDQGDPGFVPGDIVKLEFFDGLGASRCIGFLLKEVTPGNPGNYILASWNNNGFWQFPSPGDTFIARGISLSNSSTFEGFIYVNAIQHDDAITVLYKHCNVITFTAGGNVFDSGDSFDYSWLQSETHGDISASRSVFSNRMYDGHVNAFYCAFYESPSLQNVKLEVNNCLLIDGPLLFDTSQMKLAGNLGILWTNITGPTPKSNIDLEIGSQIIIMPENGGIAPGPGVDPLNYGSAIFGTSETLYIMTAEKNCEISMKDYTPTATTVGGSSISEFSIAPGDQITPLLGGVPQPQQTCNTWSTWASAPFNRVAVDLVSGSSMRG